MEICSPWNNHPDRQTRNPSLSGKIPFCGSSVDASHPRMWFLRQTCLFKSTATECYCNGRWECSLYRPSTVITKTGNDPATYWATVFTGEPESVIEGYGVKYDLASTWVTELGWKQDNVIRTCGNRTLSRVFWEGLVPNRSWSTAGWIWKYILNPSWELRETTHISSTQTSGF